MLRYAAEVAKTHSVSRAADSLGVGQPQISRAMRELERSLGVPVFERGAKGIRVTPAGEAFLSCAGKLGSLMEEFIKLYANSSVKPQIRRCIVLKKPQ